MTVQIRHLATSQPDYEAAFQKVLHWSAETDTAIEDRVAAILADVRSRGDAAVLEYTARFDHLDVADMAALELGQAELKAAFNACVEQSARFRTRHLEYAASYINKQAGSIAGNDPDVGTGGTPFMKYLKKHRDENRAQVV